MNKISPLAVSHCTTLSFSFSETLRNENVNLDNYSSYSFIIDVDGTVYQGSSTNDTSATVVLIGGLNKFVNSKINTLYSNFYITEQQKVTLYKIMKDLAKFTSTAKITSDNDKLDQSLNALYNNYVG